MENKFRWSFKQHFLLSLVITAITIFSDIITGSFGLLPVIIFMNKFLGIETGEASAIGIIGGADGPTSIFLSGNPFNLVIHSKVVFLIILLLLYNPTKKLLVRL